MRLDGAVKQSNRRYMSLIYIDYFSCRRRNYSQSYSLSGACHVTAPDDARLNENANLCGGFDQVRALTARAVDPGPYRVVRERWRSQRPGCIGRGSVDPRCWRRAQKGFRYVAV